MPKGGNILFVRGETQGGDRDASRVANPDEIDIDEEEDDNSGSEESEKEEDEGNDVPIQKQTVPSEVFGSLKKKEDNDDDDDDD